MDVVTRCWTVVHKVVSKPGKVARRFLRHHAGMTHHGARITWHEAQVVCVVTGTYLGIAPAIAHQDPPDPWGVYRDPTSHAVPEPPTGLILAAGVGLVFLFRKSAIKE